MGVLLKKLLKRNPQRPNDPKRWHLGVKSVGTIGEKEVCKQIGDEVTLNEKEAMMAMFLLRKVLLRNLLNGYTVKLGDWATFYTTVNSEGSDTEAEATAGKVKRVNLRIRFDQSFEEELQKASFYTLDSLQTKVKGDGNP